MGRQERDGLLRQRVACWKFASKSHRLSQAISGCAGLPLRGPGPHQEAWHFIWSCTMGQVILSNGRGEMS